MTQQSVLRLNVSPGLEEDVTDLLLGVQGLSGFQSFPTRGHGEAGAMSIAEQVVGRRERVQFEMVIDNNELDSLLRKIEDTLLTPDVVYWAFPLACFGRIGDVDE